ncbi:MAG TPA: helix-turn-helix domain-containing protein, partial [Vicinamibacteria bacterium]
MADTKPFGQKLKLAREQSGTPLDCDSTATRISRRHLEALESGELESLPRGPFGRSYLRAYADYLGLDPEPLLDSYRLQEAERGLGPEESRERSARELSALLEERSDRWSFPPRLWHAAGFLFLLFLAAIWLDTSRPVREPAPPKTKPPAPATTTSVPAPVQETAPAKPVVAAAPAVVPQRGMKVPESALGTGIANHAVTDRRRRFAEGEPVVFWTRVLDGKPGDVVHHYW